MQLKHTFTVPASKDETWAAFDDIESVAECFPGAQVTSVEGDTFEGTVKVKLGPIALVYKGTGTFTEKDEVSGKMFIEAKGKDKRGNGTAGADVVATLTGNGDSTDVEVVTDLNITGKPAQFGRGVIQDVSDKLLGQFVTCLESKVGSGSTGGGASAPAASPAEDAAPAEQAAPAGQPGTSSEQGASTGGGPAAVPGPSAVPGPAGSDASSGGSGSGSSGGSSGGGPSAVPSQPAASAAESSSGASSAPKAATKPKEEPEALDLGATVLPILAKAYWKQALAAVVVIAVVVWLIVR